MSEAVRGRRPAGDGHSAAASLHSRAIVRGGHTAILAGIDAVVFDFDGTLADTTPAHEQALRAALQPYELGLDPAWYRRHAGLSIRDLLALMPAARHLSHDAIIEASRARLLAGIGGVTPVGTVVELLRSARRAGLPCAVASGASRLLVRPGLQALGLASEFAAVVTSEDAPRGKPFPDLYLEAARRLGARTGRCLAVDDAPDGVTSARSAGMRVLTLADGRLVPADVGGDQPGALQPPAPDGAAAGPAGAVALTTPPSRGA